MSQLVVAIYLAMVLASGVLLLGFADILTLPEAVVGGMAAGTVVSATVTLLLSIPFGLNGATVFAGPVVLAAVVFGVSRLLHRDAFVHFQRARDGVPRHPRRLIRWGVVTGITLVVFGFIFAHAIVDTHGNLNAGYPTVWADWEQHLSTESAFVFGNNVWPHNSLYASTPLLYPFLSDFHAAELNILGLGPGAALALGSVIMTTCVGLLMICLALRLRAKFVAGILAATIIFIGGGLGFTGAIADSCAEQVTPSGVSATYTNQYDASVGCSFGDVFTNINALSTSIRGLPHLVANQPRAYDGLPVDQPPCASCSTGSALNVTSNPQWYTPLVAWWLPQRPMAYGTAIFLLVLILMFAVHGSPGREWGSAALAGILAGLLPLIHVHALLTLLMAAPFLLLWRRRKEWIAMIPIALIIAAPRMLQIASGPHGNQAWGNAFPSVQIGWYSLTQNATPIADAGGLGTTIWHSLSLLWSGGWIGFWLANLGIAVPLVAVAAIAVLAKWQGWYLPVRGVAATALRYLGGDIAKLAVALSVVFLAANVVVFQSWPWDNTKLFAYWYTGAALLIGALVANLWGVWWRNILSVLAYLSVTLTGMLVVLRLLPWTPDAIGMTHLEHVATAAERTFAAQVVAKTAPSAIFVTPRNPDDPVETIAGRTTLSGYWGWLWSYGVDFGTPPYDRLTDIATILRGCGNIPGDGCRVWDLIKKYNVSYVEIDSAGADPTGTDNTGNTADAGWWSGQNLPVIASTSTLVVYDVRNHG